MTNFRVIIALLLLLTVSACNKTVSSSPVESVTPINPELTKLEARKQRWNNAERCLAAMDAEGGNVSKLCIRNPEIKALAEGIGIERASKVVVAQKKRLEKQEQQINDGIIDKLPKSTPLTTAITIEIIQYLYDTQSKLLDFNVREKKLCIDEALGQIRAEASVPICQASADAKYKEEVADLRENEQMDAIKKFEQNFKTDLD